MSNTIEEAVAGLMYAGYNRSVATALAENDWTFHDDRVMKVHDIGLPIIQSAPSAEEAFQLYLEWNGIIGYASSIIDALDNCRDVEAL